MTDEPPRHVRWQVGPPLVGPLEWYDEAYARSRPVVQIRCKKCGRLAAEIRSLNDPGEIGWARMTTVPGSAGLGADWLGIWRACFGPRRDEGPARQVAWGWEVPAEGYEPRCPKHGLLDSITRGQLLDAIANGAVKTSVIRTAPTGSIRSNI